MQDREKGWLVMRTISIRTFAIGAIAVLTFAANTSAQTASPVLNSLQVQKLVASSEPVDNARLAAHFTALADRYTADAKRHTAMAQGFAGNPTRSLGTGMAAHCKRLADLSTESAATVRGLAAYHQKLAGGVASTPPRDGARFEGGAGASQPTDQELKALAAKASTPADHKNLEEYFVTLAKRYTADANEHVAMAQAYRGTKIAQSATHCDRLVTLSRDAAKEATAAASMHRQLANVG